MKEFTPSMPYTTAIELLIPVYSKSKGVMKKTYPEHGERLNCTFKTYGGTETIENGVYSVLDTAQIETWYRPDIKADCRIKVIETNACYEVIGKPEDINMRHQFVKIKVQAVEGGA